MLLGRRVCGRCYVRKSALFAVPQEFFRRHGQVDVGIQARGPRESWVVETIPNDGAQERTSRPCSAIPDHYCLGKLIFLCYSSGVVRSRETVFFSKNRRSIFCRGSRTSAEGNLRLDMFMFNQVYTKWLTFIRRSPSLTGGYSEANDIPHS